MNGRFFLCCGVPKSGTTFLQRMLGMHPAVSCPSEQDFETIARTIETFISHYNKVLETFDRFTGGQGAPTISQDTGRAIFRDTILNLSRGFAGGKPVHGLNDNSAFYKLRSYDELLGNPKFICIFRNPIDRAISTWHHNHRAAKEDKSGLVDHLKLLANPEGTLEGYVKMTAARFDAIANRYCDYAAERANFLTVRYEAIVEDKAKELSRLFSFLEVDASPQILDPIVARSSREAMAAQSTNPAFFGVGESGKRQAMISPELRAQALQSCSSGMRRLGYVLA